MRHPYINVFRNEDGDIVIHYIGDAEYDTPVELQALIIKPQDCKAITAHIDSIMEDTNG